MVDLGCPKLIRQVLPIDSGPDRRLTLILEPWADEFVIEPNQRLVVVFVGPKSGKSSRRAGDDRVAVYGWPDSEGFVFQGDRRIGVFTADLGQIIKQELELGNCRRRSGTAPDTALTSLAEEAQARISFTEFGSKTASDLAAYCASQIANFLYNTVLEPGESAAMLIWNISTKILNVAGFTLPTPDATRLRQFLESTRDDESLQKVFQHLAVAIDPRVPPRPLRNSRSAQKSRSRSQGQ